MCDDITRQFQRFRSREPGAESAFFQSAYGELRQLAHARLYRSGRISDLDTTLLVHESYFRLAGAREFRGETRRAFFAYASQVMRSVIVDLVRNRKAACRGGDVDCCTLDTEVAESVPDGQDQILGVHEALDALAQVEPRAAKVVEMRYFMGMSEVEIANAMGLTERSVRRDWSKARVLLAEMLAQ